jgi:hypothetical protein
LIEEERSPSPSPDYSSVWRRRVSSGVKCNTAGRFGICLMHNGKRCRHVKLYASHVWRERPDCRSEGRRLQHTGHSGDAWAGLVRPSAGSQRGTPWRAAPITPCQRRAGVFCAANAPPDWRETANCATMCWPACRKAGRPCRSPDVWARGSRLALVGSRPKPSMDLPGIGRHLR